MGHTHYTMLMWDYLVHYNGFDISFFTEMNCWYIKCMLPHDNHPFMTKPISCHGGPVVILYSNIHKQPASERDRMFQSPGVGCLANISNYFQFFSWFTGVHQELI